MSTLPVVIAIVSAVTFAGSTSVQHHAAHGAPPALRTIVAFVRYLVGHPVWLAGQVLAVVGLALHATALHLGTIAVVQPIVISGVVLAVPFRSALSGRWPWPREILAVGIAAVGLTVFLVASQPTSGNRAPYMLPAALVCGGCVVLTVAAAGASRLVRKANHRALLLGVAAGVLFGAVAGLMKSVLYDATHGNPLLLLTSWTAWALIVLGLSAVVLNQVAYRAAPLSASMPVLNVVDGVVALLFGLVAFDEIPRHSPLQLTVEVLAFAAIAAGLWLVARLEHDEAPTPSADPSVEDEVRTPGD